MAILRKSERSKMFKSLIVSLMILLILGNTKCSESSKNNIITENIEHPPSVSSTDESNRDLSNTMSFKGKWFLDKVVLRSRMYSDDLPKNGEVHPTDPEDYLGYEIEYSTGFMRFGNEVFYNIEYDISSITIAEYISDGQFYTIGTDIFSRDSGIKIDRMDEYEHLGEVPLIYFQVEFKEDPYLETICVPIGTQCVMLNNDTMLVGMWGKIILAHRIV